MNTGTVRTISAEEAEKTLAYPCFYILIGLAEPVFPLGCRAAPSQFVTLMQTKHGDARGLLSGLPVKVNWKQWRDAVVPVLEDPRWAAGTPMMREACRRNAEREWVEQIGGALRESFEARGYCLNP